MLAFVTSNQAETLVELATKTGHPADIDAAVEAAAAAVEAARTQPWIAYHAQAALAGALFVRFTAAGSAADLQAAARHARETLVMTPPWEMDWPVLAVAMAPARIQYAHSSAGPGEWKEIISELRAADRALAPQSPARPQLEALLVAATAAAATTPAD